VAAAKEKRSPSPPPARSERASVTGDPTNGDYWQVVATTRPDAEIVAEALTKKGMHAIIAPAPKEGYFRVLVGPLQDPAAQAQTRTQLEAAGFKNPIVRKY
jgi:cell division septation protein DedD